MSINDRRNRRISLSKDIIINDIIKGCILDISEGGLYIHTQAEFIPKAVLNLNFSIDNTPIKAKGFVQHIQPGVGIGIKFINLPQNISSQIKKILDCQPDTVVDYSGKKKILLVDDNDQSRSIYKNKLLCEGFTVTEASSGIEAIKKLQESFFGLVILDLWMEGIDGFKVLQIMRNDPVLNSVPVIIFSARSTHEDLEKAFALGAKEYLVKMTTSPLKLVEKVKSILNS